MRKVALALIVALAFCPATMAGDIAISTQGGWMGQGHADAQTQKIADNVTGASVELFPSGQQDALADWVVAHTGNGQSDLLVLFGIFPASIYPAGNAQPDGSLAELFLDDGNTIINTGDYIFYVGSAGNNNAEGLQNMMDVSAAGMWGDDSGATTFAPTAEGHAVTPSLPTLPSNRPWFPAQFAGTDWELELVLGQSPDGLQAHPAIFHNTVTNGRVGVFFQRSDDSQPRGQVISEWINNYYLTGGVIPNSPAWKPNPQDGAIEVDVATLEWAAAYGAVSHKVYLSTDATVDDADLLGETDQTLMVALLNPGATYNWRVDEVFADGSVVEGDVWTFATLALEAHFPSPADGATNAVSLQLNWTKGKGAILQTVFFGTDPVGLAPLKVMTLDTTADPGPLQADTTYYWRVDTVIPAPVPGPVWSFSTIGPVTPSGIPDLIAQYEFDEGDNVSLSALDTSGNDHHGRLLGDATIAGSILSLDGGGDAVDCGSDPAYHPAGSFSISTFVNMHGWGGNWSNVIAGTRGESNLGWQLRRHSSNTNLTFTIRGTTGADDPRGTIVPPLNEWIHVAAVYDADAGTRAVYIDGELDVQIADTGTVASSDHKMYIGARANGGNTGPEAFFNGDIDSLLIYNRALTIEEIRVMAGVAALAWNADPRNKANGQSGSAVLSWDAGEGAQMHDVYFGTDEAAVAAATPGDTTGIYRGRQAEVAYAPDALAPSTTYYWRVDEVAVSGSTTCVATGSVWSFTTALLIPASASLGAPVSDVPGFLVHGFAPLDSGGWGYNALNEILDTGLLNGFGIDPARDGYRIDEFVNLRDTGNGAFSEGNGYPDKSFPGIDALQVPAQDPADGDDDNNYGAEVLGSIHLTAGLHRIGANSDDGTIVWIGGIEIGRTGEWKGASNVDLPVFEVEAEGDYDLRARWLEGGGGSSLELHEILADGTRLLLNNVANGGSAVFAPPVPDQPGPGTGPEPIGENLVEDFESYAVGADLHGVNNWEGWQGSAGAGAPVSSAFALSGSNSVEIIGTSDLVKKLDYRFGSLTLSAMQYIPSGTTGDTFFILMNQYDPNPLDWSPQTKFSLGSGQINDGGGAIVYDQWVEVKYVIDLDNNTVDEYYNGVVIRSGQWDDTGHKTLQAIDLYSAGASSVYYDDLTITR